MLRPTPDAGHDSGMVPLLEAYMGQRRGTRRKKKFYVTSQFMPPEGITSCLLAGIKPPCR